MNFIYPEQPVYVAWVTAIMWPVSIALAGVLIGAGWFA